MNELGKDKFNTRRETFKFWDLMRLILEIWRYNSNYTHMDVLCFVVLGYHDDVIKWKHFPRYWPFVRGMHRSPFNSPHKGQWRGALMFSLICVWINGWVNDREASDLKRYRAHYGVTVMMVMWQVAFAWCIYLILFRVALLAQRRWSNSIKGRYNKNNAGTVRISLT